MTIENENCICVSEIYLATYGCVYHITQMMRKGFFEESAVCNPRRSRELVCACVCVCLNKIFARALYVARKSLFLKIILIFL